MTLTAWTSGKGVERVSTAVCPGVFSEREIAVVASETKGRKGSLTGVTELKVTLSMNQPVSAVALSWTIRQRKATLSPAQAVGMMTRLVVKAVWVPDHADWPPSEVWAPWLIVAT